MCSAWFVARTSPAPSRIWRTRRRLSSPALTCSSTAALPPDTDTELAPRRDATVLAAVRGRADQCPPVAAAASALETVADFE